MRDMCECPKFQKCSAAICPLDHDWLRNCENTDRICLYLCESMKPTAIEAVPVDILAACEALKASPAVPGALKRSLKKAEATGSSVAGPRERMKVRQAAKRL